MKALFFANTDWYLYNFRLALAKAVREMGIEVVLISPPGDFGPRLRAEGFRWIPVPMNRRSLNPWSEAKFIVELVSLYRRERPDIVHHFTIKPVIYGSIAARLAGIVRRVNAVTGLGHVFISQNIRAGLLRPVVRSLMKFALNGPQGRLVLQNGDDRDLFLKYKLVATGRVRLIRSSGVDTSKFRWISGNGNTRGRIRVLLATRLIWEKGIGEYVEAARLLKRDCGNIEFMIAGSNDEGNPASVPNAFISKWAGEGVIHPLGHVDNMAGLLSRVDIVVLPSYREGVPRILIEAAACGLPLVATDVPGCREIVAHNVNGLLVPAKDSISLAGAIRHLSANPDERVRMGEAGRKKALEEFDEKIVIRETLGVYRELLSIPSPEAKGILGPTANLDALAEAMRKMMYAV